MNKHSWAPKSIQLPGDYSHTKPFEARLLGAKSFLQESKERLWDGSYTWDGLKGNTAMEQQDLVFSFEYLVYHGLECIQTM